MHYTLTRKHSTCMYPNLYLYQPITQMTTPANQRPCPIPHGNPTASWLVELCSSLTWTGSSTCHNKNWPHQQYLIFSHIHNQPLIWPASDIWCPFHKGLLKYQNMNLIVCVSILKSSDFNCSCNEQSCWSMHKLAAQKYIIFFTKSKMHFCRIYVFHPLVKWAPGLGCSNMGIESTIQAPPLPTL